jgi:hypothetical protein
LAQDYEAHKKRAAQRERAKSTEGKEIGELPPVANPRRKKAGRRSLRTFNEKYFRDRFPLDWSVDHLDSISKIERCVLEGGRFAFALPRGFGKTTLCVVAVIWAVIYGHRRYLVFLAATGGLSKKLLRQIKVEIETNELLAADFPEVCYAIRKLEGINNRTAGQTYRGERTRITWTDNELIFPTIYGSPASGSVIVARGMTGAIRGMQHAPGDGTIIRPDMVVIDDPQTKQSARSVSQCAVRLELVEGDVIGLAGPGKQIAAVMPCTVIVRGDMVDQILDRRTYPSWQGTRGKLLVSPPTAVKRWDEYAEIRGDDLAAGLGLTRATEFYRENRAEMDAGAVVAWEQRFNEDEISAVQHCMNLKFANSAVFNAEYQNEPDDPRASQAAQALTVEDVFGRCRELTRATVPRDCSRITAFVDVQQKVLYWIVVAWDVRFSGAVIDYGTWPPQNRSHFTAIDPRPSLADLFPGVSEQAAIYKGLEKVGSEVLSREYPREGGGPGLRIERALVDSAWGKSNATVHGFCRRSAWASVLLPSQGRGIRAGDRPMAEWQKRPGEIAGPSWRIGVSTEKARGRLVTYDTNWWKSFTADRMKTPDGDGGCLVLYGGKKPPSTHRLFAEHLASERPVQTEGRGRKVDEWRLSAGAENHWWDCYSRDMDVLTRGGWVQFPSLTVDDEVATVNLDTDLIEYQRPTALVKKKYSGEMIQIGGDKYSRLDMLVTPTHRMVVYGKKTVENPTIRQADELSIWDRVKTSAKWRGDGRTHYTIPATSHHPQVKVPADRMASFYGWYITEGSCGFVDGTYRVVISQNHGEKADRIRDLLSSFPWKFHQQKNGFVISNRQAYDLVSTLGNRDKKRVPQWIKDAPIKVINAYLSSAVDGDGWRDRTAEAYATVCRGLADDMTELWLKAGYAVSMRTRPAKPYAMRGRTGISREQFHVHRKTMKCELLRDSKNKPNFRRVPYKGTVYCASVPNGTLIVRRNGKIAVCGNCLVGAAVAASILGVRYSASAAIEVATAPRAAVQRAAGEPRKHIRPGSRHISVGSRA